MAQKKIPYSILELAAVTQGSTPGEVFKRCLDLAQQAEALGYRRFWLAEHHNMISIASAATAVLIAYISGGTKNIRVGSGGIMLPNHSPILVTEQFGTLASLYPGRIDLGLGRAPGTDQATAQALRPDRMQSAFRFSEEISQIQTYFSVENSGAKVRVPLAEGLKVPLYILGSSTDSAHVAAEKGLPYAFASHFAPAHLLEALAIYRSEFQASEFLKVPYVIACINVIAAGTDQEAETMSTSMIRMILGVMTDARDYLQPPTAMTSELRELSQHPAFQRMLQYAFVGSKETVKQKTEAFIKDTGVNELMVASHIYHHEDRVNSYRIFSEVMEERTV